MRRLGRCRSRRRFLRGIGQLGLSVGGLALLTGCGGLPFGAGPKLPRIGLLSPAPASSAALAAFRAGLGELGYVDGQTMVLETRLAQGKVELLPELASQLVGLPVAAIMTDGPAAAMAAKRATGSIPIVFAGIGDPVGDGIVDSLARPGGNITGLVLSQPGLYTKRLELFRDTIPGLARVAVLFDAANEHTRVLETQVAAPSLGLQLRLLEIRSADDFEGAFETASRERVDGVFSHAGPLFFNWRAQIAELALTHRLPGMFPVKEYAEAGGLVAYGANVADSFRRAATYVDKILKGASPADLPVEQPTTFDYVINLKTAQALGLTIPQSVLQQATEIIQ